MEANKSADPKVDSWGVRGGYLTIPAPWEKALTDREFLEKTLAAVKRRSGLIHASMIQKGRVCALGALTASVGDVVCPRELGKGLMEVNDSMPRASPKVRRAKVIAWIEKKLKELPE